MIMRPMDKQTKVLLLSGNMIISFVFAVTMPTIQIYFISQIGANVLAVTNMVTVGLGAIVNSTVPNARLKEVYRRNFVGIVVVDIVCFSVISMLGIEFAVIRFIGIATLNAVSTNLWYIIMKNAINRVINGDELTNWDSYSKSLELYASLAGGAIAFFFSEQMNIEICIAAQCLANAIFGFTDINAFKRLEEYHD